MIFINMRKKDHQYIISTDDPIEATCLLVDWAEDDEHPLTWDNIIDVIFQLKGKVESGETVFNWPSGQ